MHLLTKEMSSTIVKETASIGQLYIAFVKPIHDVNEVIIDSVYCIIACIMCTWPQQAQSSVTNA